MTAPGPLYELSPSGATRTCLNCGTQYDAYAVDLSDYVPPVGDGCDSVRLRRRGGRMTPETPFAIAYREAEERRSQKAIAKARKLEEALAAEPDAHFYDPLPDPADRPLERRMYEGTGIGLLYRIPGCERFAGELRDWEIVPGSKKPTPLETPQSVLGARA